MSIICRPVDKEDAIELVRKYHYAKVMPRLTKHWLGFFRENDSIEEPFSYLIGTVTLGWGVRPVNTIARLFPSLISKDYLEIGKFCLRDEEPKNTESQCLSLMLQWLRENRPDVKICFTWADGFRGKAGYIYQATNFLYGGFSWTDRYIDSRGAYIHPLGSKKRVKTDDTVKGDCRTRPSVQEQLEQGIKHYWGKQFRYVYFLCDRKEHKRLLAETTVPWNREYPKDKDLQWKIAAQGSKVNCERPTFEGEVQFLGAAPISKIGGYNEETVGRDNSQGQPTADLD